MKRMSLISVLITASLSSHAGAEEASTTIMPIAGLGSYIWDYDSKFGDIQTTNLAAKFGIAVSHNKFLVSSTYTKTIDDDEDYYNEIFGDASMPREDVDLTVKYDLNGCFSVYAGYFVSDTKIPVTTEPQFIPLGIPGNVEFGYEEQGPYIGVTTDFPTKYGVISSSLSYAYFDAEMNDDHPVFSLRVDGETTGFSLGIGWLSMISQKLGYSINANARLYEFDSEIKSGPEIVPVFGRLNKDDYDGDFYTYQIGASLFYTL